MVNKKRFSQIVIILGILAVILVFFINQNTNSQSISPNVADAGIPDVMLSIDECTASGGIIVGVDGLAEGEEPCGPYAKNIGEVYGLKCDCVCCVAIDTSYCTDGTKDGTETDVDCGGFCNPCQEGYNCIDSLDCTPEDAELIARAHLEEYVYHAFPNGDFFTSRFIKSEVIDAEDCQANKYWENWGQSSEEFTTPEEVIKQPCWEVLFYYKSPINSNAYIIVYVDKDTGKVIGGTQTK